MRSGATHRACGERYGMTLRHRYDEVGLPCRKTTGSPEPVSAYEIQVLMSSSFLRGCGSAEEICESLMTTSPLGRIVRLIRRVVACAQPSVFHCLPSRAGWAQNR